MNRLGKLRTVMLEKNAQGFVVTNPYNMRYFSGFTGEGCLVITETDALVLTDSRYTEQAGGQAPLFEVIQVDQTGYLANAGKALTARKVGTALIEADSLQVTEKNALTAAAEGITLLDTTGIGTAIRAIKDADELEKMRTAARYTDDCLRFFMQTVQPGMTELDMAAELTYYMAKTYGEEPAFAHIVASGENGSMPHAIPSRRVIRKGDFITLDFGASFEGYKSDMTRTFAIGTPCDELCEIYQIVKEAQAQAQAALAPGKTGRQIDAIARDYITSKGYGDKFGHGTGHGVGLEIHESPRLSRLSEQVLEPGMVVTVEPGIYIPGLGGVRIENTCIITENSYENVFQAATDMVLL